MNKLTAEKCREQFEEWFRKHYCIPGQFCRHDKSGDYENLTVRASWRAWQASRDALPILEHQEKDEGDWIEWHGKCRGNDQPVIGMVEIKFRNGKIEKSEACSLYWPHDGIASDIIAYRMIP